MAWQPVEEVDSACERVFFALAASEILDESTDSPAAIVLARPKNPALSATKHFFNGLLRQGLAD
jgi:hypothetical protein